MPELNINETTTPTTVTDYTTASVSTEGLNAAGETVYNNDNFTKWFGNYTKIAKIKMAINAYATWVLGKGWESKTHQVTLEGIKGWGEDTFLSILWNALVIKKVNGDSYAEIIRNPETGTLLNLKPLDPASMTTIVNEQGIIDRYEQRTKVGEKVSIKKFKPLDILHLVNDRVADEIRGRSVIEAVEWNIEAQEEARRTHRKMIKRNGVVRVIEVDTEDRTKINNFKADWKKAIDDGDVLILPKNVAEAKDWHGQLDTQGVISWLNYLDEEFFMMIGIPKIILSASGEIEGDSKVSYLAFEQVYTREIEELIADLWNQLAIRITFKKPASLKERLADNEQKNASQVGFQSNDTTAGVGE